MHQRTATLLWPVCCQRAKKNVAVLGCPPGCNSSCPCIPWTHFHPLCLPVCVSVLRRRAADIGRPAVPTGAAEDLATDPLSAIARMGMLGIDALQDEATAVAQARARRMFGKDGQTGYLQGVNIVSSGAAHIHSVAVGEEGQLFAWGCGSNGRTGLQAFMRGPNGAKRALKCYVSSPSQVEQMEQLRVMAAYVGRYWTMVIARPS